MLTDYDLLAAFIAKDRLERPAEYDTPSWFVVRSDVGLKILPASDKPMYRDYWALMDSFAGRAKQPGDELHHLTPRCLGGVDESGTVYLPFADHLIAHWLLCRIFPEEGKLRYAFEKMKQQTTRHRQ